jgi:L-ascorbate metabolism protein UlaG (beta-lactamase superfamily)
MDKQLVYLRQNIQAEPLVDRWYAWTHLIPPATASRNTTERHLKIMESYINAPDIHANAVRNPKMAGGPFIDYEGQRVGEIMELRDYTRKQRAHLFELSRALKELDSLLKAKAKGLSLEPLYREVPHPLRGYVELVYDLSQRADFRLIEPLLYKSHYYDKSSQSLMLSLIQGDDRPFVLSTPRLDSAGSLNLSIPFEDERIDFLFRLKHRPESESRIRNVLDLRESQMGTVRLFLTTEPPPAYESYQGTGVRWRYFGHACILVETKCVSMLFDPVLSYTYESNISRYTYLDLPDKIDYVLITHNHQDHVLFETLLQLRSKIQNIVVPRNGGGALQDPSLKLILENIGFRNVRELSDMETIDIESGGITGLPFLGEHSDLNIRTKSAYLVTLGGHKLLFAADSCNIEPSLYRHVHNQVGDIDALFLGMECDGAPLNWLYGPLLFEPIPRAINESRRLAGSNYEQALDIVNQLNCKHVYVYAMGQEPWLNYVMSLKYTETSRPIVQSDQLIETCRSRGIVAERLFGEKEILLESLAARA